MSGRLLLRTFRKAKSLQLRIQTVSSQTVRKFSNYPIDDDIFGLSEEQKQVLLVLLKKTHKTNAMISFS